MLSSESYSLPAKGRIARALAYTKFVFRMSAKEFLSLLDKTSTLIESMEPSKSYLTHNVRDTP